MPRLTRFVLLLGAMVLLLGAARPVAAQPTLSLSSPSGTPGQTVTSTFTVQNNGTATALQFDVQFDASKLSPGTPSGGSALSPQVLNTSSPNTGRLRIVLTPLFGPTLPGIQNGLLVNLPFTIAGNAVAGATALSLANVLLANATAGTVTPGALTNGTITIQGVGTAAIVSAITPSSRSVQVGSTATAYALVINYGTTTALGCSLAPLTNLPATFFFQITNCDTNLPVGALNTPLDIPAGGNGCFIFALTPSSPIAPTNVTFNFDCTNTAPAPITPDVNTILLSASTTPTPDILAQPITETGGYILDIPGATGTSYIAVATTNVGAGGQITVEANTGSVSLPVTLTLCEIDFTTAECINPLSPAPSVTLTVATGGAKAFLVTVKGNGTIPFDPALNRILIDFHEGATTSGTVRGRASVAARTQ